MRSADWALLGFRPGPNDCTRVYTFHRLQVDQMEYREVEIDPALARGRGILLQELPVLCRWLVDAGRATAAKRLQVTEVDMVAYRDRRTAAAKPQPATESGETRMSARFAQILGRSE